MPMGMRTRWGTAVEWTAYFIRGRGVDPPLDILRLNSRYLDVDLTERRPKLLEVVSTSLSMPSGSQIFSSGSSFSSFFIGFAWIRLPKV